MYVNHILNIDTAKTSSQNVCNGVTMNGILHAKQEQLTRFLNSTYLQSTMERYLDQNTGIFTKILISSPKNKNKNKNKL